MDTAKVVSLYSVELVRSFDNTNEESTSYYTNLENAKRVAIALCKQWIEDPYMYLVTTEYHDSIRVFNKDKERLWAVVSIKKHRFVELG